MTTYLEFEKPIAELESKISELRHLPNSGDIDIAEEVSRLGTHVDEVTRVLAQGGSSGKRLDFLMQELNREANKLGSKSDDAELSQAALEIKGLIEQMRDQGQNIE